MKRVTGACGATLVGIIGITGCQVAPALQKQAERAPQKEVRTFQMPTATEVFNLRTKCLSLGKEVMEDNVIGSALTQEMTTRYDPADNRCYVKLHVRTVEIGLPRERQISGDYLYDGQTKEFLLAASAQRGTRGAQIMSDSLNKFFKDEMFPSYEEAEDVISKFMQDDRNP
jgi:hypothetical protein